MKEAFDDFAELKEMIDKYFVLKSYKDLKHIIDSDKEKSISFPQYMEFLKEKANTKIHFNHLESPVKKTFSEEGGEWVFYVEMIDREITKETDPEYFL